MVFFLNAGETAFSMDNFSSLVVPRRTAYHPPCKPLWLLPLLSCVDAALLIDSQ